MICGSVPAMFQLLTPYDVARALRLSSRRINRLVNSGELPSIEIGGEVRVDPDDLAAFVREHKTPAEPVETITA